MGSMENINSRGSRLVSTDSFFDLTELVQQLPPVVKNQPLGPRARKLLLDSTLHKGDNCSVCFEAETKDTITLPCLHRFHTECIEQWFNHNCRCPTCKLDIVDGILETDRMSNRVNKLELA